MNNTDNWVELVDYSMTFVVAGYTEQEIIDKLKECHDFAKYNLKGIVDTAVDLVYSYNEALAYGAHSHEDLYE